jgi:hypothetical protein
MINSLVYALNIATTKIRLTYHDGVFFLSYLTVYFNRKKSLNREKREN